MAQLMQELAAWLQSWLSPDAGLWGLALAAFLSATVLPGSSEVVMVALVTAYPALAWHAFLVALVGNVAGGAFTFGMGWAGRQGYQRFQRVQAQVSEDHPRIQKLRQRGPPALVLAFLPLVGDALVLAAGWFCLPFWPSLFWLALGKATRYGVVLAGLQGFQALF